MPKRFYTPWIGKEYLKTKTLLMSESAYSWPGNDNEVFDPSSKHPEHTVKSAIKEVPTNRYFQAITRTICGKSDPSAGERKFAWEQYAYSTYIPGTVGMGAGGRRTGDMWKAGWEQFVDLVNELDAQKVIITGKNIWGSMPDFEVYFLDDLQALRRRNGDLTWCLAVPHPANRTQGYDWEVVAEQIRYFRTSAFPTTSLSVSG